jgi:hypothetical protein
MQYDLAMKGDNNHAGLAGVRREMYVGDLR